MTPLRSAVTLAALAGALAASGGAAQELPGAPLEEARPPSLPQPDRGDRPSGAELELPGDTGLDRDPGRSFEHTGPRDAERPEREEGQPPAPVTVP